MEFANLLFGVIPVVLLAFRLGGGAFIRKFWITYIKGETYVQDYDLLYKGLYMPTLKILRYLNLGRRRSFWIKVGSFLLVYSTIMLIVGLTDPHRGVFVGGVLTLYLGVLILLTLPTERSIQWHLNRGSRGLLCARTLYPRKRSLRFRILKSLLILVTFLLALLILIYLIMILVNGPVIIYSFLVSY